MRLVRFETQGESHSAMINPEQVSFLAEGIYGTSIHFASGEYIVCVGDLAEVAARLQGDNAADAGEHYLITASATTPPQR